MSQTLSNNPPTTSAIPNEPAPASNTLQEIRESVAAVQEVAARLEALHARSSDPPVAPSQESTPDTRVSELESTVERLTAALAQREETRTIQDLGDPPRLTRARNSMVQVELALAALIEGVSLFAVVVTLLIALG